MPVNATVSAITAIMTMSVMLMSRPSWKIRGLFSATWIVWQTFTNSPDSGGQSGQSVRINARIEMVVITNTTLLVIPLYSGVTPAYAQPL